MLYLGCCVRKGLLAGGGGAHELADPPQGLSRPVSFPGVRVSYQPLVRLLKGKYLFSSAQDIPFLPEVTVTADTNCGHFSSFWSSGRSDGTGSLVSIALGFL